MKIIIGSFFTACLLMTGIVYGHTGAMGIVKERMDAMKDMGDHSKSVGSMFKGRSEFNQEAVAEAADAFVLNGKQMAELFPDTDQSKGGKHTEALPKIWEEWDDFSGMVEDFIAKSEALQKTVASTDDVDQLETAFLKVTKNCSGCHKKFRKPKR